jgi:hypothetical protein
VPRGFGVDAVIWLTDFLNEPGQWQHEADQIRKRRRSRSLLSQVKLFLTSGSFLVIQREAARSNKLRSFYDLFKAAIFFKSASSSDFIYLFLSDILFSLDLRFLSPCLELARV